MKRRQHIKQHPCVKGNDPLQLHHPDSAMWLDGWLPINILVPVTVVPYIQTPACSTLTWCILKQSTPLNSPTKTQLLEELIMCQGLQPSLPTSLSSLCSSSHLLLPRIYHSPSSPFILHVNVFFPATYSSSSYSLSSNHLPPFPPSSTLYTVLLPPPPPFHSSSFSFSSSYLLFLL